MHFPAAAHTVSSAIFQMCFVHRNALLTSAKWWIFSMQTQLIDNKNHCRSFSFFIYHSFAAALTEIDGYANH